MIAFGRIFEEVREVMILSCSSIVGFRKEGWVAGVSEEVPWANFFFFPQKIISASSVGETNLFGFSRGSHRIRNITIIKTHALPESLPFLLVSGMRRRATALLACCITDVIPLSILALALRRRYQR
jgi:hypothetical protein